MWVYDKYNHVLNQTNWHELNNYVFNMKIFIISIKGSPLHITLSLSIPCSPWFTCTRLHTFVTVLSILERLHLHISQQILFNSSKFGVINSNIGKQLYIVCNFFHNRICLIFIRISSFVLAETPFYTLLIKEIRNVLLCLKTRDKLWITAPNVSCVVVFYMKK